jgi:hypothetical protein
MAQMSAKSEWSKSMQYYESIKRKLQLFKTYFYLKSL